MRIAFYGGVGGEVTGANYLLEDGDFKALVDCGLAQGSRYCEDLNYQPFEYQPALLQYVFLTHSHIDHTGRLPKLVKDGFRGLIYATEPVRDILEYAWLDSQRHLKDEAEQRGQKVLYDKEDIEQALKLFSPVEYHQRIELDSRHYAIFHDAGHILGSAIVELGWQNHAGHRRRIFFSGDLGNPPTPLLRPTEFVHQADYVLVESAYGNRIHESRQDRQRILKNIIQDTIKRRGVLMIPSFAMERTQELLFELNHMVENKQISDVAVFVDSPLAIQLTRVYQKYSQYFNQHTYYLVQSGDDVFQFRGLRMTETAEESKAINGVSPPKVIIAGSGMSQGGRILHHERRYLPDQNSTILFIGFQVEGSLGRRIFDMRHETDPDKKFVRIFKEQVPVRCKIEAIGGYSAHADQEGLLRWVREAAYGGQLKTVFVVQGEYNAATALAQKIKGIVGTTVLVPRRAQMVELN